MKADEMQRFAQQTEEIEKQALSIANKLNESNTKSFLAKNKMIELNEKARKIALSIDSPKRKFIPCDAVRYPCDEITNSVGEDLIDIDNSSAFEMNSDYFNNPELNYYKANNEDFLYSKTPYPYYDGRPIVGKSLSPDINSNDSFYPDFSQPNKPSRRYFFDKEKSVKSEVIDIEEFDYERDLNEDPLKSRERISSNIRKVDIDEKDRRELNNKNLRKNLRINPKGDKEAERKHYPPMKNDERTNEKNDQKEHAFKNKSIN